MTPRPIFSLQLQNHQGHTGMLLGLDVDMVPLQNGDNLFFLSRSCNSIWRPESGFASGKMRILNISNNLSQERLIVKIPTSIPIFSGSICSMVCVATTHYAPINRKLAGKPEVHITNKDLYTTVEPVEISTTFQCQAHTIWVPNVKENVSDTA